MVNLWNVKSPKTTSSKSITSSSASAAYNEHPPTQSTKKPNRGMSIYCHCVKPALADATSSIILQPSAIQHLPSLQLFFTHTTGHTHPISQKTSESKVHEVCRYSQYSLKYRAFSFLNFLVSSHYSLRFSAGP